MNRSAAIKSFFFSLLLPLLVIGSAFGQDEYLKDLSAKPEAIELAEAAADSQLIVQDTISGDTTLTTPTGTGTATPTASNAEPEPEEPNLLERMSYFEKAILGIIVALMVLVGVIFGLIELLFMQQWADPETSAFGAQLESVRSRFELVRKVVFYGFILFFIGYVCFLAIEGTKMEAHVMEWLNLVIRWAHVVFGMAWIGTSFYFVFLENALERKGVRDDLYGNLWAVHGGGIYYIEKFKKAPKPFPKKLHWFKWEAYLTWLTGFSLLTVVYYFNARSMMVDPEVMDLTSGQAVAIGIGTLLISFLFYEGLGRTPLLKKKVLFFGILFVYLVGTAWVLTQFFNPRAAYIHIGGIIGTWMAGNVFTVIIPSQKAMLKAVRAGKPLDTRLGELAMNRSLHNNYLTLPVIFIMISNHFPSTFGHAWNWLVLGGLTLASAGVKHYFNLKEKGQYNVWIMPVSIALLLGILFATAPRSKAPEALIPGESNAPVEFYEAYQIVVKRCQPCHSENPTDDEWASPPNGLVLETPLQIQVQKDKIMQRVVIAKNMPQGNKTGITEAERDKIRRWIEQGAEI